MDANEVRRRVDAIIERQDEAMLKLEESRHAFDTAIAVIRDQAVGGVGQAVAGIGQAIAGIEIGLDGLRGANEAQAAVIASLRAGNREALQILRNLPQ
jgi:hypothetical protein